MTQDYSRFSVQVESDANNEAASIPTDIATNSNSHGSCSAMAKTTITNFPVAPQIHRKINNDSRTRHEPAVVGRKNLKTKKSVKNKVNFG